MSSYMITAQAVVSVLKTAGFVSYLNNRGVVRNGYRVVKLAGNKVGVLAGSTYAWDTIASALTARGYKVNRVPNGAQDAMVVTP